jgi:hypothetical protein
MSAAWYSATNIPNRPIHLSTGKHRLIVHPNENCMRFNSTLCSFILITLLLGNMVHAQNTTGNRWLVWYPELGTTGDAPSAAFSIKSAENVLADVVGSPTSNPSNSYAIGNDVRGYVYYEDRTNKVIRVVDPLQQTVVGVWNYSTSSIKDIHAFQAFYVSATNKHYMVLANLYGNLNLTAVAILDVSNPNAIVFEKHIVVSGIVKQYAGIIPSLTPAGRVTGMTLTQSAYTSAATTLFLASDDGVKAGSLTNVTVNGVANRHPGVYIKITDPLNLVPSVTLFETYYDANNFFAPEGSGGPHQIMYDEANNRVYMTALNSSKILSFNASTGAPTYNVYQGSTNTSSGGFHGLNLNKLGTELYAGRSGTNGIGEDRVYKFSIESNKLSSTIINQSAVSPELWSTADPVVKGVNLTPDETYLYAITESPGGVFLLDKATLSNVQAAKKADGNAAVFSRLDPHTYAFTLHDYGDAPASYGRVAHNLTNQNGNFVNDRLRLGSYVDGDTAATTSNAANGDDNAQTPRINDEDGITPSIVSSLVGLRHGMTGTYTIANIPVRNVTGISANLVAWIDFNHNGIFETAEGTITVVPNNASTATLNWAVPANVTSGGFYLRMRLTHDASITTAVPHSIVTQGGEVGFDGEVEDHFVNPVMPVSGNVFNDVNGNSVKFVSDELNVDGTNINGTTLYAYLVVNGIVIDKTNVLTNGCYSFANAPQKTNAVQVILGSNNVATGSPSSSVVNVLTMPPSGWIYTGESDDASADPLIDGKLTIDIGVTAVVQQNFGIERLPDSDPKLYFIGTPAVNSFKVLNGSGTQPGPLSGSDPEDGILGTNKKIAITSLPTNGHELWYNGTKITKGADGINPPSPTNAFIVPNYNSGLLQVKFTGLGSQQLVFRYSYFDAANKMDLTSATYEISWQNVLSAQGLQLKASMAGDGVLLNWYTQTESNTSYFEVQKSTDGNHFSSIAHVQASNNSSTLREYETVDHSMDAATIYYRIKLYDQDGSSTMSNTVSFNTGRQVEKIAVHPNVINSRFNISLQAAGHNTAAILQLVDMAGKVIWVKNVRLQKGQNTLEVQRRSEPEGMYILVCSSGTALVKQKVLLSHP